jgi:hypothetical protein
MALLYGRAGRLTAKNGGFRPGQMPEELRGGHEFEVNILTAEPIYGVKALHGIPAQPNIIMSPIPEVVEQPLLRRRRPLGLHGRLLRPAWGLGEREVVARSLSADEANTMWCAPCLTQSPRRRPYSIALGIQPPCDFNSPRNSAVEARASRRVSFDDAGSPRMAGTPGATPRPPPSNLPFESLYVRKSASPRAGAPSTTAKLVARTQAAKAARAAKADVAEAAAWTAWVAKETAEGRAVPPAAATPKPASPPADAVSEPRFADRHASAAFGRSMSATDPGEPEPEPEAGERFEVGCLLWKPL